MILVLSFQLCFSYQQKYIDIKACCNSSTNQYII